MPLTVIYETHSTRVDNEAGLASGHADPRLSPLGRRQAAALGRRRGDERLDAVLCGDRERQRATAALAFPDARFPILIDARLRECDYGKLTRAPAADVEAARAARVDEPFPEGESYRQAVERHRAVLTEAEERWPGGRVLLIGSHAAFVALEHLCAGVPLHDALTNPRPWQPGWSYEFASSLETA